MLTQNAKSPHDAILSVQSPTHAAVRMGDWKLLYNAQPQKLELYNLATDIGEANNLAAKEPERLAMLRTKLAELLKDAAPPGQLAAGGKE